MRISSYTAKHASRLSHSLNINCNTLTHCLKLIILVPKDLSLQGLSNATSTFGLGSILAEISQCSHIKTHKTKKTQNKSPQNKSTWPLLWVLYVREWLCNLRTTNTSVVRYTSRSITTFSSALLTWTLHPIIKKLTKVGSNYSILRIICLCFAHAWIHFYFLWRTIFDFTTFFTQAFKGPTIFYSLAAFACSTFLRFIYIAYSGIIIFLRCEFSQTSEMSLQFEENILNTVPLKCNVALVRKSGFACTRIITN